MIRTLLQRFGWVRREDFEAKADELQELTLRFEDAQRKIAALEASAYNQRNETANNRKELDDLRLKIELLEWCDLHLYLWPRSTPEGVKDNTARCWHRTLKASGVRLGSRSPDDHGPTLWALSWALAHASRAAGCAVALQQREDAVSDAFLAALASQAKTASRLIGEPRGLNIAYTKVYNQCGHALKEAHVGADILLLVAGRSLVRNGWAKAFWIQAKRAGDRRPFVLDCREENNAGRQVDALARMHKPQIGAFGYYIQYASKLTYIPAVSVAELDCAANVVTADLSKVGARLAEMLVADLTSNESRSMANADAVITYLETAGEQRPLYIVTIEDHDHALSLELSLETVKKHYLARLGPEPEVEAETPDDAVYRTPRAPKPTRGLEF